MAAKKFEAWLTQAPTAHSMVERIGKEFELGGHKAAAIGLVLENAHIDLVSEMDPNFVRSIFMTPGLPHRRPLKPLWRYTVLMLP